MLISQNSVVTASKSVILNISEATPEISDDEALAVALYLGALPCLSWLTTVEWLMQVHVLS